MTSWITFVSCWYLSYDTRDARISKLKACEWKYFLSFNQLSIEKSTDDIFVNLYIFIIVDKY